MLLVLEDYPHQKYAHEERVSIESRMSLYVPSCEQFLLAPLSPVYDMVVLRKIVPDATDSMKGKSVTL